MFEKILRNTALGLLTAGAVSAAVASPLTWAFTGIVTSSSGSLGTGQTVSGSLTMDPTSNNLTGGGCSGGTGYSIGCSYFAPSASPYLAQGELQGNPWQVSGAFTDPTAGVATSVGGGDNYDFSEAGILRDQPGGLNEDFLFANSSWTDGRQNYIELFDLDYGGTSSPLYADGSVALSALAHTRYTLAFVYDSTWGNETISLTSLTLTDPNGVPEPRSLLLAAAALAGLGFAGRRQA